jgi:hypothetical protein
MCSWNVSSSYPTSDTRRVTLVATRPFRLTIVLSVHFSVLFVWPLCCMYIFDLRLLIIPLVSLIYGLWLPFWYLWFTASDYPFGIFDLRLLITPLVSLIYGFWLPLWYLWFTACGYPFGIFDLRLLITPLVSLIYGLWLPLWYLWFTPLVSSNFPSWQNNRKFAL